MKITTNIQHEIELELTQEQKEAFRIVDDFICDLYNALLTITNSIRSNDNSTIIAIRELDRTSVILETMLNAPSFRYIEDTD